MKRAQERKDDQATARLYDERDAARLKDYKLGFRQGARAAASLAVEYGEIQNGQARLDDQILAKLNLIDISEIRVKLR